MENNNKSLLNRIKPFGNIRVMIDSSTELKFALDISLESDDLTRKILDMICDSHPGYNVNSCYMTSVHFSIHLKK